MDDDADPMVPSFRVVFNDVFTDLDEPADVKQGYEAVEMQERLKIPTTSQTFDVMPL